MYDADCLLKIVKHGDGFCMFWTAISWFSADPLLTFQGKATRNDYVDILVNHDHPIVQTLVLTGNRVFQENN